MSRGPGTSGRPARVLLAAATAGAGGGEVALRAALASVAEAGRLAEVWLPRGLMGTRLPDGPDYRFFGRVGAVARELLGPPDAAHTHVIGMSDRLPLVRRPAVATMVLQNNFLYGPPKRDFPLATRARLSLLRLWARASARRADAVISATVASIDDLVASTGIDRRRVHVVPIPPQNLPPAREAQHEEVLRVLMVGTVYEYKRFGWATSVLDRWASTRAHRIELVHIGGVAEPGAGVELRTAAESAEALRVSLMGAMEHTATIDAMCRADVLVFPSIRESFGLPLAEALGLGVPALCSDIAQFRELAQEAALYFRDESSFCEAMDLVLPRHRREAMARSGLRRVRSNAAWDVMSWPAGGDEFEVRE